MSRSIENIYRIKNNPFVLSDIIVEYYKCSDTKPNDLLVLYLILPIVLYKPSNKDLQTKNITRSIKSFKKARYRLYGLEERIQEYKTLSNQCLQHSIDQGELVIDDDLSIRALEGFNGEEKKSHLKKASRNLAIMFDAQEIVSIYRQLGIKKL